MAECCMLKENISVAKNTNHVEFTRNCMMCTKKQKTQTTDELNTCLLLQALVKKTVHKLEAD